MKAVRLTFFDCLEVDVNYGCWNQRSYLTLPPKCLGIKLFLLSTVQLVLNVFFPHRNQLLQTKYTIFLNDFCLELNLSCDVLNFPLVVGFWPLVCLIYSNYSVHSYCALLNDVEYFRICTFGVNSLSCYRSHSVHTGV